MFTPAKFRAKAAKYTELEKAAPTPAAAREFHNLEQSFITLADNEQWLSDNYDRTIHAPAAESAALPPEDENILRYLGAALIMQWDTLPAKLQRELFDTAGSMGELVDTAELRGQIARFLHKHKGEK
jgi:hypothetical protein